MRHRTGTALWIALALTTAGCGGEFLDADDQVRRWLEACEEAAEARDANRLQDFVAEGYADAAGRDARAVRSTLGIQLLRRKQVHLLTRIERIDLPADGEAEVTLYAAMAGSPLEGLEALANLQGSLYRFDLSLRAPPEAVEAGDWERWRLVSAAWRRAVLDDFRAP